MRYLRNIALEHAQRRNGLVKIYHVRKVVGGRVVHRTFSSRTAAEVYRQALELRAVGIEVTVEPGEVGQVLDQFLAGRERLGRVEITLADYRQIRAALVAHLGAAASVHLTSDQVEAYVEARRGTGAGNNRILRELGLLRTAVRKVLGADALDWALPEIKKKQPDKRCPSDDEIATVWGLLDRLEHRRAFALGLLCGMRQEDVFRTRWEALPWAPATWPDLEPHARVLRLWMGKTGRLNPVPVCSTLAGLLLVRGEPDQPIAGCTPDSLRSHLWRQTKKWKHPWNGIGILRHVCSTWMAQSGQMADAEIGLVLGHAATGGITRRHYIHDVGLPTKWRGLEVVEERFLNALTAAAAANTLVPSDRQVSPEVRGVAGSGQKRQETARRRGLSEDPQVN